MSESFSGRAGTISGFDIVLSLSEEAINKQLQKLYDTPVDDNKPLPPPLEIDKFGTLEPTKYLINRRLSVHFLNEKQTRLQGKRVNRRDGIDAYINCPKVRFRPPVAMDTKTDPVRKYRTASIEITFTKDEQGEDSKLLYFDPETPGELESYILTGKTMSWAVNVAQQNVDEVLTNLIEGKENVSPASEKLRNFVNNQVFTVASIYCLFDKQLVQESFNLVDEQGKVIQNLVEVEMRRMLAEFYANMQAEVSKTHAQVPDFPFSLGYSISQKMPKKEDITQEMEALMSKNRPYFVPKQFSLTVTPGDGLDQKFLTTSGTLNFCMLTHRNDTTGERVKIDEADFNAGIIKQNFFDVTKTLGKTKDSRGNTQGHDGIMGFSKELLVDLWVPELVEKCYVDPKSAYLESLRRGLLRPAGEPNVRRAYAGDYANSLSDGYEIYRTWCMDRLYCTEDNPYSEQQFVLGDVKIKATISSELGNIHSIQEGLDHARRLYIDLDIKNTITYAHISKGINTRFAEKHWSRDWWNDPARHRNIPIAKQMLDEEWLNARTYEMTIRSLIRIRIHSGAAGKWDIDVDKAASRNLFEAGQPLAWTELTPEQYREKRDSAAEYGNFSSFEKHHSYERFGRSEVDKEFREAIRGWETKTASIVRESLQTFGDGLSFCVVMPAGDVFTFAGLDTDAQGRLYAQVDYSKEGGVEVRKG
ncbi:hypothetical protein F4802DRAFT_599720 [Xylaria palmicola]|nr:hypothetical protein F4802DRAFT_599720 [Xylaria palmicola]